MGVPCRTRPREAAEGRTKFPAKVEGTRDPPLQHCHLVPGVSSSPQVCAASFGPPTQTQALAVLSTCTDALWSQVTQPRSAVPAGTQGGTAAPWLAGPWREQGWNGRGVCDREKVPRKGPLSVRADPAGEHRQLCERKGVRSPGAERLCRVHKC